MNCHKFCCPQPVSVLSAVYLGDIISDPDLIVRV